MQGFRYNLRFFSILIFLLGVVLLSACIENDDSSFDETTSDDDASNDDNLDDDAIDDDLADDDQSDDDIVDDDSADDDSADDDQADDDAIDDDAIDDDTCDGPYWEDFQRYWQTMDEGYAYFIEKDVDWNAIYAEHAPQACSEQDRGLFSRMLAQITAGLHDSHTWSSFAGVTPEQQPFRSSTGVCLMRADGEVYVSRLTAAAETAGMLLGDHVTQLDGEPVDDVLAEAESWEGCSTAHCCDYWRLPHVERFSAGIDKVAYAIERGDETIMIELDRAGGGESTCKPQPMVDFLADASGTYLRYKPIGDDLGYLYLPTLSEGYMDQILDELDTALSLFGDRDGLIFDARFNHGGSDLTAMAVLARFLDQTVVPVTVRYKNGPAHDDFTFWVPEPVLPGSSPIATPVVFLINGGCISAADFFVAAATYLPTFTVMGTTSCGGTGAPRSDVLPDSGITYNYSQMQRKYLATGEQVEGRGIAPDIVVEYTPNDLAAGIDSQIEAAIDWLRTY